MRLVTCPGRTTPTIAIVGMLFLSACGGDDADSTQSTATTVASVAVSSSTAPPQPATSAAGTTVAADAGAGDNGAGSRTGTVTFVDDGTTRTFDLDECFTSDSDPGRFASGVASEGAMSVHGTDSEGWELNLSVMPDADGTAVNFSFLTDGVDADYQLGDLTYSVDGNTVTASANSDIYQTLSETESIPLTFDVTC